MRIRFLFYFGFICFLCSCSGTESKPPGKEAFNHIAERYVRLGLYIGQFDEAFVDAYYGPDSLRPAGSKPAVFPKDSLLKAVDSLSGELDSFTAPSIEPSLRDRADWLKRQLTAFGRRIKWFGGENVSFDEEAKELFSIEPPVYDESHFRALVSSLDSLLPGSGTVQERAAALSKAFIIPPAKVDTVFKLAHAEARKRSKAHLTFPDTENFSFEYVHDKPWSGYNWYKGEYRSVIQQNLDLPISIERAIDLACHEGYPGHHVYNMLLEKNLYRDSGWVEISLYPLYSPQSLIAEGSANYGIDLAFPGEDKIRFIKEVLCPAAGLDTTGVAAYLAMFDIKTKLNYARNEAARGLLNNTMTEEKAIQWMMDYMLITKEQAVKFVAFIRTHHSYVICYNFGQDLVKEYIDANGGATGIEKRWSLFGQLLSSAVTPAELRAAPNK